VSGAVGPKKKLSKRKTRTRKAANMKLAMPARSICPRCDAVKQPHVVCPSCGWYRNRQVIQVEDVLESTS
jgi:large subunit ribosomal protein L32